MYLRIVKNDSLFTFALADYLMCCFAAGYSVDFVVRRTYRCFVRVMIVDLIVVAAVVGRFV